MFVKNNMGVDFVAGIEITQIECLFKSPHYAVESSRLPLLMCEEEAIEFEVVAAWLELMSLPPSHHMANEVCPAEMTR